MIDDAQETFDAVKLRHRKETEEMGAGLPDGGKKPFRTVTTVVVIVIVAAALAVFVGWIVFAQELQSTTIVGAALVALAGLSKVVEKVDRVPARIIEYAEVCTLSAGLVGAAVGLGGVILKVVAN